MARPTGLTPSLQDSILAAVQAGAVPYGAAARCGVAKSTFYDWLRRARRGESPYAEFSDRIRAAQSENPSLGVDSGAQRRDAIFVGRDSELSECRHLVREVCAGRGAMVLLGGEAGIGKTRLAEEVAREAARDGVRTLWGRSWDTGAAPPYWPWAQIIRSYAAQCAPAKLAAELGSGAPHVAHMVPVLRDLVPGAAQAEPPEHDEGRFQLFDSTVAFLRAASRAQPLMLVFDDLHAADQPTLLLLNFLARELREMRLMVIGTYRDPDAQVSGERATLLGHLGREARYLSLRGLDQDDVGRLVDHLWRGEVPDGLVGEVVRRTGGVPFFVAAVTELLLADHAAGRADSVGGTLPVHVRQALAGRLAGFTPPARELLTIAAVADGGSDLDLGLMCELSGDDRGAVSGHVEDLVRSGVLRLSGEPGTFVFAHGLIRDALYEEVDRNRRAHWHRAVAGVLERRPDASNRLGEIIHHYLAAGSEDDRCRAAAYATQAGAAAMAALAFEEAVRFYEVALRVLGPARSVEDEVQRGELLLGLGGALRRSGMPDAARARLLEVARVGREVAARDDQARGATLLAQAGLTLSVARDETGVVDGDVVALLGDALRLLPEHDSLLRCQVLAHLASALHFSRDTARRTACSEAAVTMARRLGEPRAITQALLARHLALWRPGASQVRLEATTEVLDCAERGGEVDAALAARTWRFVALLELGEVERAEAEAAAHLELAAQARRVWPAAHGAFMQATLALLRGDFVGAQRHGLAALMAGQRASMPNHLPFFAAHTFLMRDEQGELGGIEAILRDLVQQPPAFPVWRCALALMECELGRLEAARREFEGLAARDFADLPVDGNWLPAMVMLARVAVALNDGARARQLYELLAPFEPGNVVVGMGAGWLGPVARYLGLLATARMQWEVAERHFETAAAACTRMGARPHLAHVHYERATLRQRSGCGDAGGDLAAALAIAEALGMQSLSAKVREARRATVCTPPSVDGALGRRASFCREARAWLLGVEGREFRIADSLGLRCIALLLHHPGEEIHATELLHHTGGRSTDTRRLADLGEAALRVDQGLAARDDVFDRTAREAYKRRLDELRGDIDLAEAHNDRLRAGQLREEAERLTDELASAVGRGGRAHRVGSPAERARVRATRAIKRALRHIGHQDEALAAYLTQSIKTGTFCCYVPRAPHIDWTL